MSLSKSFEHAVEVSRQLQERPSNEHLLKLYSLYKQATAGDATGDRPGGFDFKAIAKYDAWASLAGMDRKEAMKTYIELVESLIDSRY
jgi:acyl-CoA-binding protein